MNPPDEFRKHANDRVQIAKLSRGPESSAMWNRMAERWRQCAERYVEQTLAARDRSRTGTGDPRLVGLAPRSSSRQNSRNGIPAGTLRNRSNVMPTSDEYRHMEEVVLKLAGETTEPYAKEAPLELAVEFHDRAVALQREDRWKTDTERHSASR
jgi:hypothetical protein